MQTFNPNVFIPANRPLIRPVSPGTSSKNSGGASGGFEDILAQKTAEGSKLQFSKHAEMRLKSRNIALDETQMERAVEGVGRAKLKGIRDSLVLVDDVALVINTRSNVVITALDKNSDNIFTNIDGAVIV